MTEDSRKYSVPSRNSVRLNREKAAASLAAGRANEAAPKYLEFQTSEAKVHCTRRSSRLFINVKYDTAAYHVEYAIVCFLTRVLRSTSSYYDRRRESFVCYC